MAFTWLVLLVTMHLALCGPHGPDSAESCGVHIHTGAVLGRGCVHSRCWATTRPMVQTVPKPVEFPQVQSSPLLWRRGKSPWSR